MVGPAKLPKAKAEVKRPDARLCTLVRQNMMEWKRTKDQSRLSRIVKVGSLDLEMIKSWIVTSRLSVRPIPGAACVVQCHPQFNISTNALQWFMVNFKAYNEHCCWHNCHHYHNCPRHEDIEPAEQ